MTGYVIGTKNSVYVATGVRADVGVFNMAYGPCWSPVMASVNAAMSLLTTPSVDPSPRLPFWDKYLPCSQRRYLCVCARVSTRSKLRYSLSWCAVGSGVRACAVSRTPVAVSRRCFTDCAHLSLQVDDVLLIAHTCRCRLTMFY